MANEKRTKSTCDEDVTFCLKYWCGNGRSYCCSGFAWVRRLKVYNLVSASFDFSYNFLRFSHTQFIELSFFWEKAIEFECLLLRCKGGSAIYHLLLLLLLSCLNEDGGVVDWGLADGRMCTYTIKFIPQTFKNSNHIQFGVVYDAAVPLFCSSPPPIGLICISDDFHHLITSNE